MYLLKKQKNHCNPVVLVPSYQIDFLKLISKFSSVSNYGNKYNQWTAVAVIMPPSLETSVMKMNRN